jgi:hypothetical protein
VRWRRNPHPRGELSSLSKLPGHSDYRRSAPVQPCKATTVRVSDLAASLGVSISPTMRTSNRRASRSRKGWTSFRVSDDPSTTPSR